MTAQIQSLKVPGGICRSCGPPTADPHDSLYLPGGDAVRRNRTVLQALLLLRLHYSTKIDSNTFTTMLKSISINHEN